MRLNNKGFAISSMMYSILLLFLMLVLGVLGVLGSRKVILDKIKGEILTDLTQNNKYEFSFDYKNILLSNTSKVDNFIFSFLDGVKIVDQNGNVINSAITTVSEPEFKSDVNGVYTITYTAEYKGQSIEDTRIIEVIDPITYEYAYTGREQSFTAAANGLYRTQLWGASGGDISTYTGGKGAYTVGDISLNGSSKLYLYVGGAGANSSTLGGYNGGGSINPSEELYGRAGGGATDVRLDNSGISNFNSLKSRIMVAAGGGGANARGENYGEGNGGAGGSLVGLSGTSTNHTNGHGYGIGTGGTQTGGGTLSWTAGTTTIDELNVKKGTFGNGEAVGQSGGGAGYYGGGAGRHGGAGGGSSFISGYAGGNAVSQDSTASMIIHTGEDVHYSGMKFINASMKTGAEEMPNYDGSSTMVGNSGNGYAKITVLIIDNGKIATNLVKNSSFEEEDTNWTLSNSSIVSTSSKTGNSSLLLQPNVTSMNTQSVITPIAGHIYYGSVEFLSSGFFTTENSSFELYNNDSENGKFIFAQQNIQSSSWTKLSTIGGLAEPTSGDWTVRNFMVNASENTYVDDLFIIDLTEIYGEGYEPTKEWCDANIQYFDGVGIVPKYLVSDSNE